MSKKKTLKPKLYKLESKLVMVAEDAEGALDCLEELVNEKGGGEYRNTFYKHVKIVEIKSADELPPGVTPKKKPVNGESFYNYFDCGSLSDDENLIVEDDFWDCISYASTINDYLEYSSKK